DMGRYTYSIALTLYCVSTACEHDGGQHEEDSSSSTATDSTSETPTSSTSGETSSGETSSSETSGSGGSSGDTTGRATTGSETTTESSESSTGEPVLPPPSEDWTRDILSTGLELDLATLSGTATIVLAGSESTGASFEIGDLEIASVQSEGV